MGDLAEQAAAWRAEEHEIAGVKRDGFYRLRESQPGELLAQVRALGNHLASGLERISYVAAVRGRGLMLAFDLVEGMDAPQLARRALIEQRLVTNATGPATIRLEPPLIVSEDEIDDALARLEALAG